MADDADAVETATNGQSVASGRDSMAAVREAFIAREAEAEAAPVAKPTAGKEAAAGLADTAGIQDDDSDLDAGVELDTDDEDLAAAAATDVEVTDEDPDADLDEEVDKGKPDPEVAKRLAQVQRTDKRLREQREAHFAARERELVAREEQLKPHVSELERFEKLKSRGFVGMIDALAAELNASEDEIDLAARRFYAMSKAGKADPKLKAAVDALEKERLRDKELESIKKKLEEQETEKQRAAQADEERRFVDSYLGKVAKAATDKTPIAKKLLAADPQGANIELGHVAQQLGQQLGRLPEPHEVVIAFEKQQRRLLRRFGIDPKTLAPSASTTTTTTAAKPTPKPGEKKPAPAPKIEEKKPLTKDDFIRGIPNLS
jgi:hypothetical protein